MREAGREEMSSATNETGAFAIRYVFSVVCVFLFYQVFTNLADFLSAKK